MAAVPATKTSERNLNLLAHRVAGEMGKPEGTLTTLELTDGSVVEGTIQRFGLDPTAKGDKGRRSPLVIEIRLEDVADIRETYGALQAEVAKLRSENAGLKAAMKRAVALVPPVAAADLRREYRRAAGRGGAE